MDANIQANRTERLKLPTAKWGAACGTCATAKAKCLRSNTAPGSKCDRCERLYKDCVGQVHRPRKKRTVKPSRTAQIEERLNGLVSMLKASGGLNDGSIDAEALSLARELESKSSHPSPSSISSASFLQTDNPWAIPATYNSCAPPSCICRPESGDAPPPPDSDDTLLDIYRNEMQRIHPFVIIEPTTTAGELNIQRPFLMASIRMVASFRSLRSMRAQMYYLMKHISDHMLIRSEKSLDLLLGILVILGWYQYHCFLHAQMSNLISLATSLVTQLNLNKPTHDKDGNPIFRLGEVNTRTNEEKRAYAGAWFMASASSIGSWDVEPMRYTTYLQRCINELEMNCEYDTDAKLVSLVRIQYLTERITQINNGDGLVEDVFSLPPPPRSVYLPAFQQEWDRLSSNIPERLRNDSTIQLQLHTAALRLYEPPVVDTNRVIEMADSLSVGSPNGPSALDELYRSRKALVDWFGAWGTIPVTSYHCQTTTVAAQIVYAVTMLGRWARLTAPRPPNHLASKVSSPLDPSLQPSPNSTQSEAESQYTASIPAMSVPNPSQGKIPCDLAHTLSRHDRDPRLPEAVAALQARLKSRPDLVLDIPELLSSICARLEAASATLQHSSAEAGTVSHNIWSMGAIKVRIARVRIERWADMISERLQNTSLDDAVNMAGGPSQRSAEDQHGDSGLWVTDLPADDVLLQNFGDNPAWTSDLLQGMDPSVLFNGYWDWESAIMNSMGSAGQPE